MSSPGDFAGLFEAVPDALVLVDGSGRITRANSHAERLFGYRPGSLVGLQIEALLPEAVRARHHQHRAGYMKNPRVRPMGGTDQALVGQRLDGQQFPVEIALSPISGADGPRYLASIRDVSESQRARQAQVRAGYDTLVAQIGQFALESSDGEALAETVPALLSAALDHCAVAIVLRHPETNAMEVKAASGLDAAWKGALARPLAAGFWNVFANGAPIVMDDLAQADPRNVPFEGLQGSCAIVPLLDRRRSVGALVSSSPAPRRFGHDALHLLGSAANVLAAHMQRRRTEEQLIHSQRIDAIGKLTGGVAHDFNNLLTIVSGNLQLLDMATEEQPELSELIESAMRATARGGELTSKLLTFARRQRLNPQAIEPLPRLEEVAKMLRRTLGESITLIVECPDAVAAAHADPMQFDTALVNLALNARDAMPYGGTITMQARDRWVDESEASIKPGRYVAFTVADTGQGMAPDVRRRAVEPFFTTKPEGRGSGLGLSMVYGFAEQSGGALEIDSRLGYGTRIELILPASAHAAMSAAPAPGGAIAGNGEIILVVEDDAEVRKVAVSLLEGLGYQPLAVGNATDALALLESRSDVALLFTDVRLDGPVDGIELAQRIRRSHPGIGILLTSGYPESRTRQRPDGPYLFDLLAKPYRREGLAAAVARTLTPRV